jgi:hypothetical protein
VLVITCCSRALAQWSDKDIACIRGHSWLDRDWRLIYLHTTMHYAASASAAHSLATMVNATVCAGRIWTGLGFTCARFATVSTECACGPSYGQVCSKGVGGGGGGRAGNSQTGQILV